MESCVSSHHLFCSPAAPARPAIRRSGAEQLGFFLRLSRALRLDQIIERGCQAAKETDLPASVPASCCACRDFALRLLSLRHGLNHAHCTPAELPATSSACRPTLPSAPQLASVRSAHSPLKMQSTLALKTGALLHRNVRLTWCARCDRCAHSLHPSHNPLCRPRLPGINSSGGRGVSDAYFAGWLVFCGGAPGWRLAPAGAAAPPLSLLDACPLLPLITRPPLPTCSGPAAGGWQRCRRRATRCCRSQWRGRQRPLRVRQQPQRQHPLQQQPPQSPLG